MTDPLAQFRKSSAAAGSGGGSSPKEEYAAFAAKDRVARLRVRRRGAVTRSPGYSHLLDVVYDGSHGTSFVLVYTFMMVLVRGQNLQMLVAALEGGMVDFIQEFDSSRWVKPSDKSAAVIESIEIEVQESGTSVAEAETLKQQIGR